VVNECDFLSHSTPHSSVRMPRSAIPAAAKLLFPPVTLNVDLSVFLIIELDLLRVKINQHFKYLHQRSLCSIVIARTQTERDTHTQNRPIALPGPFGSEDITTYKSTLTRHCVELSEIRDVTMNCKRTHIVFFLQPYRRLTPSGELEENVGKQQRQ